MLPSSYLLSLLHFYFPLSLSWGLGRELGWGRIDFFTERFVHPLLSPQGRSPLHVAIVRGYTGVAEELIKKGADIEAEDKVSE